MKQLTLREWRTERGLPAKPEDYDIKFDDGLVVGDDDKPMMDGFLKRAHELNMPPEFAKETLAWYFKEREADAAALSKEDDAFRLSTEDALRKEWGDGYRKNINLIGGLMEQAPPGLKERLFLTRLSDGKIAGNDPGVLRWLAGLARQINPTAAVVPGEGAAAASAIETEIADIEKLMRTDRAAYNKDPAKQQRLRDLYAARDGSKGRP